MDMGMGIKVAVRTMAGSTTAGGAQAVARGIAVVVGAVDQRTVCSSTGMAIRTVVLVRARTGARGYCTDQVAGMTAVAVGPGCHCCTGGCRHTIVVLTVMAIVKVTGMTAMAVGTGAGGTPTVAGGITNAGRTLRSAGSTVKQ